MARKHLTLPQSITPFPILSVADKGGGSVLIDFHLAGGQISVENNRYHFSEQKSKAGGGADLRLCERGGARRLAGDGKINPQGLDVNLSVERMCGNSPGLDVIKGADGRRERTAGARRAGRMEADVRQCHAPAHAAR